MSFHLHVSDIKLWREFHGMSQCWLPALSMLRVLATKEECFATG